MGNFLFLMGNIAHSHSYAVFGYFSKVRIACQYARYRTAFVNYYTLIMYNNTSVNTPYSLTLPITYSEQTLCRFIVQVIALVQVKSLIISCISSVAQHRSSYSGFEDSVEL